MMTELEMAFSLYSAGQLQQPVMITKLEKISVTVESVISLV
jgi:hypothetical protein